MGTAKETILDNVDEVTELSESILSDVADVKRDIAALLTDKDGLEIYGDIGLLMNALESINASATRIGWTVAETKKSLEKEP